jgi:hypothetical protein
MEGSAMSGWPVATRVLELKGDKSYRDLEEAIFQKTGKRIRHHTLQRLVSEHRGGSRNTIEILAEYAEKPISWFYTPEDNSPLATAEAKAQYLAGTGDRRIDTNRRMLLKKYFDAGLNLTEDSLNRLIDLAQVLPSSENVDEKRQVLPKNAE